MLSNTDALRRGIADAVPDRPFTIIWWDGTTTPATSEGGPTFTVRSPRAVGHLLRSPGQLGLGRAYVSGELTVDDIDKVIPVLSKWTPPTIDGATRRRLMKAAIRAHGLAMLPKPPESELRPEGRLRSLVRDSRAVRHHYDVGNEFFALFLDETMTYSCAVFSRGATTLEEAQDAKRELICTKLALQSGERLLDVGCGWGALAIHAAKRHGVSVLGITLSPPQAEEARRRAEAAGVADRVEFRVLDWRDLEPSQFDAISSIGMSEHVGEDSIAEYALRLTSFLRPGGRLLNHAIARLRHNDPPAGPFSERYVWPDAAPLQVSRVVSALEHAGLEIQTVEGLRKDYSTTLTHWAERLDAHHDEAERYVGADRLRIWRLYLRVSRDGFDTGFLSVFQVLTRKPD